MVNLTNQPDISAGNFSVAATAAAATSKAVAGTADASSAAGSKLRYCCVLSHANITMPLNHMTLAAGTDWWKLVSFQQEAARDICWQLDHRGCRRHNVARSVQWCSCAFSPRPCSQPTCDQCCSRSIRSALIPVAHRNSTWFAFAGLLAATLCLLLHQCNLDV